MTLRPFENLSSSQSILYTWTIKFLTYSSSKKFIFFDPKIVSGIFAPQTGSQNHETFPFKKVLYICSVRSFCFRFLLSTEIGLFPLSSSFGFVAKFYGARHTPTLLLYPGMRSARITEVSPFWRLLLRYSKQL